MKSRISGDGAGIKKYMSTWFEQTVKTPEYLTVVGQVLHHTQYGNGIELFFRFVLQDVHQLGGYRQILPAVSCCMNLNDCSAMVRPVTFIPLRAAYSANEPQPTPISSTSLPGVSLHCLRIKSIFRRIATESGSSGDSNTPWCNNGILHPGMKGKMNDPVRNDGLLPIC